MDDSSNLPAFHSSICPHGGGGLVFARAATEVEGHAARFAVVGCGNGVMVLLGVEGVDFVFEVDFFEGLEEGEVVLGGRLANQGLGADQAVEAVDDGGLGAAEPGQVGGGGGLCDGFHEATEDDALHFDLGLEVGGASDVLEVGDLGGAELLGVEAVFEGVAVTFLAAAFAFGGRGRVISHKS